MGRFGEEPWALTQMLVGQEWSPNGPKGVSFCCIKPSILGAFDGDVNTLPSSAWHGCSCL